MKAMQVVKLLSDRTGKSFYRISTDMGKTKQYVSSILNRNSIPQVDTYVKILEACGYALCAIPIENIPQDAIVIDDRDENDSKMPLGGTRRTFSSIFDWEMSDKTLMDGEELYRIETGYDMASLYFTASAGTPLDDIWEHAKSEMRRHFGKKGPSMILSIDRIDIEEL